MLTLHLLHLSAFPMLLVVFIGSKVKCCKICKKWKGKVKGYLFWNGTIRIFTEAYVDLCLFSLLNLNLMNRQTIDLYSLSASDHLSFAVIEYLILLPIICAVYIFCRRKKLHKKRYKRQCGEFLDGTKYENKGYWKSALAIALVFFVRRALLCLVLVVSHDFLWGQISQAIFITTLMIIFLQWFGPL